MGGSGSGKRSKLHWESAPDRAPWDRQPNESDLAWRAFVAYRDLGLSRTLAKATQALDKKPNYVGMLQQWSRERGWRIRVEEWDREKDRVRRAAEIKEIEDMRKRHVKLSISLQGLGATELKKWMRKVQQDGSVELTPDQVLKLIEAGIKLERLNRGEPEEIFEQRTKQMDEVEVEQRIDQLLKAYKVGK